MLDQDTQAVVDRLRDARATSGLSLRQFARALGTSPSRFSAYCAGRTAPSAAFLLRAERIAAALSRARARRVPSSLDAAHALERTIKRGDEDWAYAMALEVRDRLRDVLAHHRDLTAAWEAQPAELEPRWQTLVSALVAQEFRTAGIEAPRWTQPTRLDLAWVLDTPRLTADEVREQTPAWLAERNIFIAAKDLVTA